MGFLTGFEHFVRENEPMAGQTWFRLGGPAEYFAEPTSVQELVALVRRCREEEVSVRLLGAGSNVLIRDEGAAGMRIVTSREDNAGLNTIMSNSFGFGGTNATLVFKRPD